MQEKSKKSLSKSESNSRADRPVLEEYIRQLRKEYSGDILDENSVERNPYQEFIKWLEHAVKSGVQDPHAMVLATASPDGVPSARVVLLREYDNDGFIFFTNYGSRKATEALKNPRASILFFWREMDRQIRIEGRIEKVDPVISDRYFESRPKDSQIAAWASNQSELIRDREELEKKFAGFEGRFLNVPVPRPENWGGLRLRPERFEFWQGRPGRLHDRIVYALEDDGSWRIFRLAP